MSFFMIQKLHIAAFRNITDTLCEFSANKTQIFLGKNGQGKTNILEAIYLFSIGKLFRSNSLYDAIPFDGDMFQLSLATDDDVILKIQGAKSPRKQTKYSINDVPKTYFSFIGNIPAVLFSPEDLLLIHGTPSHRRKTLDSLLVRKNKNIAPLFKDYEKTLRQRNSALKQIQERKASLQSLSVWNEMLAELAEKVWKERIYMVEEISPLINKLYNTIADKNYDIEVRYNRKHKTQNFLDDLINQQEKDIIIGSTSLGPHRDDLSFYINNIDAHTFASQGEGRTISIAWKLAEHTLLEKAFNKKPVLLLDDIFSELDEKRQSSIIDITHGSHTFMSTNHIHKNMKESDLEVFLVEDGKVNRT